MWASPAGPGWKLTLGFLCCCAFRRSVYVAEVGKHLVVVSWLWRHVAKFRFRQGGGVGPQSRIRHRCSGFPEPIAAAVLWDKPGVLAPLGHVITSGSATRLPSLGMTENGLLAGSSGKTDQGPRRK